MFFINTKKVPELNHSPTRAEIFPGFALIEYFNFFYYLGQFPFRLKYSPQLRRYATHTNLFQQASFTNTRKEPSPCFHKFSIGQFFLQGVCLFMNVCVMFNLISYLRWYAVGGTQASFADEKNDLLYFSITLSFCETVLGVSMLITTWFYSPEFEALVNFYHVHLSCLSIKSSMRSKHVSSLEVYLMSR